MKKYLLWIAAFSMIFTGCKTDENIENGEPTENKKESYTFKASFENNDSRSYLGDDEYCYWETTDHVSVFNANGTHYTYSAVKGDVKITDLTTTTETTFADGENIYALYPYQSSNKVSGGTFTSTLPANQTYGERSLDNAIMVASTQAPNNKFSFKNACALIMFELTSPGDNIQVESIRITSLSKKSLAGTATIGSDYTATISSGSSTVTLAGCASAGTLSETAAKKYILVIPAGTYAANDLLINIDTNNDFYDKTTLLSSEFTVARSKYIKIQSSLTENVLNLDTDPIRYKAIMCYNDLIVKQGFEEMEGIEHDYQIPDGDYTINGNGVVYEFTPNNYNDKFIYTTFTSKTSGISNVTPGKITVNDLTIKGTLRTTTMGIYVTDKPTREPWKSKWQPYLDQSAFITEWNNVNVLDNNILPYAISEEEGGTAQVTLGSAVCVYGVANLNECKVTGTVQANVEGYQQVPYYDMALTNRSITTLNNSTVGRIRSWEHADLTVTNKSAVDLIDWNTLGFTNLKNYKGKPYSNQLSINKDSEVITLNINGHPSYPSSYPPLITIADAKITKMTFASTVTIYKNTTIKASAKIGTLKFTDTKNAYLNSAAHTNGIKIEDGAIIDKIIVGETEEEKKEYTLEQFKALQ